MIQGKVLDGLVENFLFENIGFIEQFVGHFGIALVSISKLKSVDWTLCVVLFGAMVSDQPI